MSSSKKKSKSKTSTARSKSWIPEGWHEAPPIIPDDELEPMPQPRYRRPYSPQEPIEALGIVSKGLSDAIDNMDQETLCTLVKSAWEKNPGMRAEIQNTSFVKANKVIRYHRDEDEENDSAGGDDTDGSDMDEVDKYPIALGDDVLSHRFAKCERCNKRFDVSENSRSCYWHSGKRFLNRDEADSYYEEGELDWDALEHLVFWDCCDEPMGGDECKRTKHKAAVNQIVKNHATPAAIGHKRKAQEDLVQPKAKKE